MHKLTILLIPMILLSSCMIDWSNKKEATMPSQKNLIQTGAIIVETPKGEVLNGTITKDFGSGFYLTQTDNETRVSYSGKTIKTWSNIPPKKVPFVGDEACVDFFEAMDMISPVDRDKDTNWKQATWEKFDETTKKNCMKEYFWNSIQIEGLNSRFFKIIQTKYDGAKLFIYDIKSENLQQIPTMGTLKISESTSGITVFINMSYGDENMKLLYNNDFSSLLSTEEIPK